MTVLELVQELLHLPHDAKVFVFDFNEEYANPLLLTPKYVTYLKDDNEVMLGLEKR